MIDSSGGRPHRMVDARAEGLIALFAETSEMNCEQ
jgi:hypothetical protein